MKVNQGPGLWPGVRGQGLENRSLPADRALSVGRRGTALPGFPMGSRRFLCKTGLGGRSISGTLACSAD